MTKAHLGQVPARSPHFVCCIRLSGGPTAAADLPTAEDAQASGAISPNCNRINTAIVHPLSSVTVVLVRFHG